MLISLIVAMAQNRCIGREGRLPWHLPGDLQRFKQLTMGHSLLMGRKTFESIGRPLPGRTSYVLSRSAKFDAPGCRVFAEIDSAIAAAEDSGEDELFVCGGEDIYRQLLPRCERIYLTELEREVAGDRYCPAFPTEEFRRLKYLRLLDPEPSTFAIYERL